MKFRELIESVRAARFALHALRQSSSYNAETTAVMLVKLHYAFAKDSMQLQEALTATGCNSAEDLLATIDKIMTETGALESDTLYDCVAWQVRMVSHLKYVMDRLGVSRVGLVKSEIDKVVAASDQLSGYEVRVEGESPIDHLVRVAFLTKEHNAKMWELREASLLVREKLMKLTSCVADITDCSSEIEAVKALDVVLGNGK